MGRLRSGYNAFIERHDVAWELAMAVLAVVFVVVGFGGDASRGAMRGALETADLVLTAIFVAEFASLRGRLGPAGVPARALDRPRRAGPGHPRGAGPALAPACTGRSAIWSASSVTAGWHSTGRAR
ncbi:MAG: hypothetical protein DLM71_06430 [Chloroflexi bacterium]|nr:MAG: hypothetical protein DLM71_06430 [Chloroflexota bacterium]